MQDRLMTKTSDYYYDLPQELIAQTPLERRDSSRLMVLNKKTGEIEHKVFTDILDYLHSGDVLAVNNSRVMPSRLIGKKEGTDGAIEFLLLKQLGFVGNPYLYVLIGSVSVYNVIITRTFMESNIPDTLMEAAQIDGCSMRRFFISIVLPLSPAIIAILALFYAVGQWNSWFNAMLYLRDNQMPLQNILRNILKTSSLTSEMGMESAIGSSDADAQTLAVESMRYAVIIVSSLPVMCLYPFVQKYFIKGIMVGAIKG